MLGRFLPSHDTIKQSRLLRWLGPRIRFSRLGVRIGEHNWARSELYLRRRGGPAIFLSRFLPGGESHGGCAVRNDLWSVQGDRGHDAPGAAGGSSPSHPL